METQTKQKVMKRFIIASLIIALFIAAIITVSLSAVNYANADSQYINIPQITVLTHGWDGYASQWSSADGIGGEFSEDPYSLLYKLSEKSGGANIYRARTKGGKANPSYTLYKDYGSTEAKINSVSKHIIIVFDSENRRGLNEDVYFEFKNMLNDVIGQVAQLNPQGAQPQVNLIGHSRGGLTNLQFALDYPERVNSIISIGTPYFGSDVIKSAGRIIFPVDDDGSRNGIDDIVDNQIYDGYYQTWNNGYESKYKNVNSIAIGGALTIDYQRALLNAYIEQIENNDSLSEQDKQDSSRYAKIMNLLLSLYLDALTQGIAVPTVKVFHSQIIKLIPSDMNFTEEDLIEIIDVLNSEIHYGTWYSDVVIPVDSQQGFSGQKNYKFTKYVKEFSESNRLACPNREFKTLPLLHNIESYDADIHEYILKNIVMKSGDVIDNEISNVGKIEYTSGHEWQIKIRNTHNEKRTYAYNSQMCYFDDAKNWTGLKDVKVLSIEPNTTEIVNISSYGTATSIAVSSISGDKRYINYADNLWFHSDIRFDDNIYKMTCYDINEKPYYYEIQNGIKVGILGKDGDIWRIELTNNTGRDRSFLYNNRMCFESDARDWVGLVHVTDTEIIVNGESTVIEIQEYGTASSIAISYLIEHDRYIFFAKNLSTSCTMTSYGNTKLYRSYTQYGMKVGILSKEGDTWTLGLENKTGKDQRFYFNNRMCFESDAKNWTNLSDPDEIWIPNGGELSEIKVREYGTASSIAISYKDGINRYIFYANELDAATGTMTSYKNKKPTYYTQNGLTVAIVGKEGDTWTFQLTNNTGEDQRFYFNNRMCFESDAKNWTNLSDPDEIWIPNGRTDEIKIREYGTATSIAISYKSNLDRYIFYAKNINDKTSTMTSYGNIVKAKYYTQNGITVAIADKIGSTWKLQVTNNIGSERTIYYNSRMCFEGDAKEWKGLSDVNYIWLPAGGTSEIQISEYGTATSIALSYMDGNYRKVFYAKELNAKTGTMSANANAIDTTAGSSDSCIAEGTLITLADGRQVPVESLTGNEMLLVWNLYTGTYDAAPIMFIDSDPIGHYEVIKLSFSDGTVVNVISEHGFWDLDLNRYVYLDENAERYIGHWFVKQSENGITQVRLTSVDISTEVTTAYSPVTYGHLCYFVDGMLSMPGGIDGLFNIFEIDGQTMTIDEEAYSADIAEYGTFTYEEFCEKYAISEDVFEAFNGKYLKVAIGKGLITEERIGELIERYSQFF